MKLAERMSRIGTESAFDVLVRARALEAQGRDVIHLEIGEPDFPTPQHIIDAGKKALDEGWTHYGPSQGLPELREAIAEYISAHARHSRSAPANVCVAPGGKPIIFFPMLALLGPGRRSDLPESRISDLRIDDQGLRRDAGAGAAGRRARLFLRSRRVPQQPDATARKWWC